MMTDSLRISSALDVVQFLEKHNGKLVTNIAVDAIGHVLTEFDNFSRMKILGEIDPKGRHVYLGMDEELAATMLEMYQPELNLISGLGDHYPEMARSIALYRPDLTADVGISSFKIAPVLGREQSPNLVGGCFVYRSAFYDLLADQQAYIDRKFKTYQTPPLRKQFDMSGDLERFLGLRGKPLAVVQIKDANSSGAPMATDPKNYISSIEFLLDQGFRVVQAGRERYPDCFARLGVVNYANSSLASFKNDLILSSHTRFSLMGPSGICMFAENMLTPFVQVNNWMLANAQPSPYCVSVPCLSRSLETGNLVRFEEQMEVYASSLAPYFNHEQYTPVQPDARDTLAGTMEALAFQNDLPLLSEKQQRFQSQIIQCRAGAKNTLSRTSSAFLDRYDDLF